MFDTEIKLVTPETQRNENGFQIKIDATELVVMAEKRTVSGAEVYRAMQADLAPTDVFWVHSDEWALTRHVVDGKEKFASKVIYNGATYDILRIGSGTVDRSQIPSNTTVLVCG